jgi:hypothetical protein
VWSTGVPVAQAAAEAMDQNQVSPLTVLYIVESYTINHREHLALLLRERLADSCRPAKGKHAKIEGGRDACEGLLSEKQAIRVGKS